MFDARLGDGDATRTDELEHTTEVVQATEELQNIVGDACLLDRCKGWIDLDDAGVETSNDTRYLLVGQDGRGREFEQRGFEDEDLVIDKTVGLKHVNLLLYLLDQHLGHLALAVAGNRVFMYAWSAAGTYIKTLDVDLSASKDGGNLVEDTGVVLGVNN